MGIISAWGYKVRNPNHIQYRISDISNNEQSATDMGKTPFKNDFTNEPVEMPQDDRDQDWLKTCHLMKSIIESQGTTKEIP